MGSYGTHQLVNVVGVPSDQKNTRSSGSRKTSSGSRSQAPIHTGREGLFQKVAYAHTFSVRLWKLARWPPFATQAASASDHTSSSSSSKPNSKFEKGEAFHAFVVVVCKVLGCARDGRG